MTTKTIASLAIAIALSFATSAFAEAGDPQVRVDTSAYALGTPAGQQLLNHALRSAAASVCVADGMRDTLVVRELERRCMARAMNSARQQLAVIMEKDGSGKNPVLAFGNSRDIGSPKH